MRMNSALDVKSRSDSHIPSASRGNESVTQEELQDLNDRRDVLQETLSDGVSERDRLSISAELAEVIAMLQPADSNRG